VFIRPVDELYPVQTYFGEKNPKYEWSIDPDNGLWIPVKTDGHGDHRGIDYACPFGTIVRAMSDGFIIRSRFEDHFNTGKGAGLYITQLVTLLGFDSWILRYSHLSASYMYPGQSIRQGQAIALSGNSGDCDSPYLHIDLMNLKGQWKDIPF